jgi:hypothetical protein
MNLQAQNVFIVDDPAPFSNPRLSDRVRIMGLPLDESTIHDSPTAIKATTATYDRRGNHPKQSKFSGNTQWAFSKVRESLMA